MVVVCQEVETRCFQEAITDLSQNRTLFVQKLTHEEQFTPQVVYDLKLWMKSLIL